MIMMTMRRKLTKLMPIVLSVEANSHMMKTARNVKSLNLWKKKGIAQKKKKLIKKENT